MIKILFVVAYTLMISTSLGLLVSEKFNLNRKFFAAPIGFATLLFLLQLAYYPIQLFNLSSFYIMAITSTVYLALGVYSVYRFQDLFKQYYQLKSLWIVFFFVVFLVVFFHSSISIPRADGQMYLNYIAQNIDNPELNNFNLWTGLEGAEFVTIYLFQGYYHFAGFLVKFVNLFSDLGIGSKIDTIVVSIWGLGSLYALVSSMFIVDLVKSIKVKSKIITQILIFFSLFFTNFYYWKVSFSFYGNTWRSLFMAMFLFSLYQLIKDKNRNYIYVAAIIFGASIATSSSSLFIGFSIMLGVAFYFFHIKSPTAFQDLSYIGIPMVVFVLALMYKDHFSIFIVLLIISITYYSLHRTVKSKQYFIRLNGYISNHANMIFLVVLPVIAVIYSFIDMTLDPYYPWNVFHYFNDHASYDMVKNYIFLHSNWVDNILNVFRWLGVILLFYGNDKSAENKFLSKHFLVLFLFFLNPLTTSFISRMFASNVYYRAFEALFNVFTEALLFSFILNYIWNRKFVRMVVSSFLIVAVLYSHFTSFVLQDKNSLYGFYMYEGETVLPLHKIRSSELDVIKVFEKTIENFSTSNDQITVVSHADGLRTFTPNVYQVFTARQYWSSWDRIDQEFYQLARMWYGWEERPSDIDYTRSCYYLNNFNIDFVINEIWENADFDQAINECTTILHENYEFRLRQVKRR